MLSVVEKVMYLWIQGPGGHRRLLATVENGVVYGEHIPLRKKAIQVMAASYEISDTRANELIRNKQCRFSFTTKPDGISFENTTDFYMALHTLHMLKRYQVRYLNWVKEDKDLGLFHEREGKFLVHQLQLPTDTQTEDGSTM